MTQNPIQCRATTPATAIHSPVVVAAIDQIPNFSSLLEVCMRVHVRNTRAQRGCRMARILIAAAICVALAIMLASPLHAHVLGNCTVQSHDGFANVRARPTTRAPILWRLQNGTRVSAYDVHHRWLWIKETIGTKETMTGTGWARRWSLSCDKPLRWR
jgi:hypothetical protein